MDYALQVRQLTKKIRNKTIVDSVSFDVPKGEIFGLLGPNGAGKTTIIRMIVGLISITEGEVVINGMNAKSHFRQAMEQVGAIVENPELYKFLTGYQNLLHFARMTPGVSESRIDEVISLVNLESRIDDEVKTYSLGMRQRLGVAQAILQKPSVLILDEPTNGLDPAGIRELRDHLRQLAEKEGTTVIVSSHLLTEMELMCDRVAIIQSGRLISVQPVKQLKENENEQRSVQFEVDKPKGAFQLLDELGWNVTFTELPTGFQITLPREKVAELNAKMVEKGFRVYGIKAREKTLEDRFLEVTGGYQNA